MDEAELEAAMAAAAAHDDFEEAARLRNALFVLRADRSATTAPDADYAGIRRQQPGAMGIGSQFARPARPDGWTPPVKPLPLTRNTSRRDKRRR